MDRSIPGSGEMYTDQEGRTYQILCVADHFETKEKMVVYQALYGAFEFLIRPLGIFMRKMERKQKSAVSEGKKFRYETSSKENVIAGCPEGIYYKTAQKEDSYDTGKLRKECRTSLSDRKTAEYDQNKKEEQANPTLMAFLDAETLEEKYQVIKSLQHSITDRLIDDFAVTLDLVIPDGKLDDRYQQLLSSVRTMQKFETKRFRR